MVLSTSFQYDQETYGTCIEELGRSTQYTVPVVVNRSRILRTRAKFDPEWSCTFKVDVDDEMIDLSQLLEWLDIAGRQIGLGDWRPEKSGMFGQFAEPEIEKVEEDEVRHGVA